jgi:NADH-quinone oxidoreductase subunit N
VSPAALFRLLAVAIPTAAVNWPMLVAVLAAASMTLGNLAAFFQTSVKRLLAYSTISQVGYRGLAYRRPGLAAVRVVSQHGLVGTPPTGVFLGKLQIFTAAIDGGYGWLAGLAVINTVASLFYYLRWLAPAFLQLPGESGDETAALEPVGRWAPVAAYTAGAASLALGVAAAVILPLVTGHLTR